MTTVILTAKRLAIGAVTVGALTLGTAGAAGAATSTASVPQVGKHFNCAKATKVLARVERAESRITAGLPKLEAAEAKAVAAGRTARAGRIEKRITRLKSGRAHTRLTRVSAAIQAKCHVPAPSPSAGSSSQA